MDRKERKLLEGVFDDEGLAVLREELRVRCLEELRVPARRRRGIGLAAAALLLAAAALLLLLDPGAPPRPGPTPPPDYLVATRPLPAGTLVEALPPRDYLVQPTSPPAFTRVTTPPAATPPLIDDRQLLAAFADTPCALVGGRRYRMELVFLKPEDSKRYYGLTPQP